MPSFDKIHEYTNTVCEQIRWKKAHASIREEIKNHVKDQRDAYIRSGEDEEAATDQAIMQMGDPVMIGNELDRTHRPKPQWTMLILTIALVCMGLIIPILFDIYAFKYLVFYYYEYIYPLMLAMLGLGLMTAAYLIDFTWIGKHSKAVYGTLLAFTVIVFIMKQAGVFRYYYYIDAVSPLFPLGFAALVYAVRNKGYRGIVICEAAFLIPAVLLLTMRKRPEFMLFAVSVFAILCIALARGWFKVKMRNGWLLVLIPTAIALILAGVVVLSDGHKLARVQAAFNLSYDPSAECSVAKEIKGALAGSKFIGRGVMPAGAEQGPGFSVFYMLTCMVFHFGWISVIPVVSILLFFIIKGFCLCFKQKSALGLLVSVSVMMTFTVQTIGYLLFNLGFDLFNPLFIPFVIHFDRYSYLINLALIGMMLSVFRTGHVIKDRPMQTVQNHRRIMT